MIEIPLGDHDAELLPPLHEYFKSFWSDTAPGKCTHAARSSQDVERPVLNLSN